MSKIAIIYWSQTGNTETMAKAILEGAKEKGHEAELFFVSEFDVNKLSDYDVLALGCPSMGVEVLEEEEFEPFFASIESSLAGKDLLLFGSYGWGNGEWMRNWEDRCKANNAKLLTESGIICQEAPDSETINILKSVF